MKVWIIKMANGKYAGEKGKIVPFGFSKTFRGEKAARDYISKMALKHPEFLSCAIENINIFERKSMPFKDVADRMNAKDTSFFDNSANYKLVARSKYGFLNKKYNGYSTLEERFSSSISNGACVCRTFGELVLNMQVHKGFATIPGEYTVQAWVRNGSYKDTAEATAKFDELVRVFEGEGLEICFLA